MPAQVTQHRAALGLQWNERIDHSDRSRGVKHYPVESPRARFAAAAERLTDFETRQCRLCEVFFWRRRGSTTTVCYRHRCRLLWTSLCVISQVVAGDPDRQTFANRWVGRGSRRDENDDWLRCHEVGLSMPYFVEAGSKTDPFISAYFREEEKMGRRIRAEMVNNGPRR